MRDVRKVRLMNSGLIIMYEGRPAIHKFGQKNKPLMH